MIINADELRKQQVTHSEYVLHTHARAKFQ